MSPLDIMSPRGSGHSLMLLQVSVAEDRRFELLRGCPQHAFQQCCMAFTGVRHRPRAAQAGKAAIPVHLLLSHRAGLPAIKTPLPTGALYDWGTMTRALAAQTPWWEPGTRHGYHAFTFGWLVGEVVRRITGTPLGAYWRDEVAQPLGLDCHIGLAAEHDARVAEFIPVPPPPTGAPDFEEELLKSAGPMVAKALNNPPKTVADMNTRSWRAAEIPAGNAHTNARALARVYGALACGGEVDRADSRSRRESG